MKHNLKIKKIIAGCAAFVLACGLSLGGVAEERQLGNFIYVPAMGQQAVSGTSSLRVSALVPGENGEVVQQESLAGCEFGVYVISTSGELTPWANPLYPSEPMRIRTGEEATRFTLPAGAEFYLRQESAPAGYLFDGEALTLVTGGELVVQNVMAAELALRAEDSQGAPIAGVKLTITMPDGSKQEIVTDDEGNADLSVGEAGVYGVEESELPEGVFAAMNVHALGQTAQGGAASVRVEPAQRVQVTFEHPAAGGVRLAMRLREIDAHGEATTKPLLGVRMTISGGANAELVTDESGEAELRLMEGLYDVTFAYEGAEDVVLPLEAGQMLISSGAATEIALEATRSTGRIVVTADCERSVSGGSMCFVSESDGQVYGPVSFDADGVAVSELLPAGAYRLTDYAAPQDTQAAGFMLSDGTVMAENDAMLNVAPGGVTAVSARLLTMERQRFALYVSVPEADGSLGERTLDLTTQLELVSMDGSVHDVFTSEQGGVTIEGLSGQYTLHMPEDEARSLGIQPISEPFTLPQAEEGIVFASSQARVRIIAVDENGASVPSAVYIILDGAGAEHMAYADADGVVISDLLSAGEATVHTQESPENYNAAADVRLAAAAGCVTDARMLHESYGTAAISCYAQSLDERGNIGQNPVEGISVRVFAVGEDGSVLHEIEQDEVSGADGSIVMRLPAGNYAAQMETDTLGNGWHAAETMLFSMENGRTTEIQLVCLDALGGVSARLVGGELTSLELAQVRFVLENDEGETKALTLQDGAFYVGGLAAGEYTLRQTQIPQGYTLASEQRVVVAGGEVTQASVALEEYARVRVSKTGLTFNDKLQTFVVPLTGKYGVYTMEGGAMLPYPSEENQATVWANSALTEGRSDVATLPADAEGKTYYLHEIGSARGFTTDENYYELRLIAGDSVTVNCAVTSDRGFFDFDAVDSMTAQHVPGGLYALVGADGETVQTFTLEEGAYRNEMAVPVGAYTVRQLEAAEGYCIADMADAQLNVTPYLMQGESIAQAQLAIPQTANAAQSEEGEIYASTEQELTMLVAENTRVVTSHSIDRPQTTVEIAAADGERLDVVSVVLSGTQDAQGGRYAARVEYCLASGGWQPSSAKLTGLLDAPTAVGLADASDDICAIRVTYLNENGLEIAGADFMPGQIALGVKVGADGETRLNVTSAFSGYVREKTAYDGETEVISLHAMDAAELIVAGSGAFDTVSAGRDGSISGFVFFDDSADGVLEAQETDRFAGMTVSLLSETGDVLETCRTGKDGSYRFGSLASGSYAVQFSAGESFVFSRGRLYSEHAVSGIEDTRYGMSGRLVIDGAHSDYVVNAGCIAAASVSGSVMERMADGSVSGFEAQSVELRPVHALMDEEPILVTTDSDGRYAFGSILPGEYILAIRPESGYLCETAEDGEIRMPLALAQGESYALNSVMVQHEAMISGCVRVDDDGDGSVGALATPVEGVRVRLMRVRDGHTDEIAETMTGLDGEYVFDGLLDGSYSLLFELSGSWTFTRYGEDSCVFGAVSQNGSTNTFELQPGEALVGMNVGVTIPAELAVTVFADNGDGYLTSGEMGLEGVALSLIRMENGMEMEEITAYTDEEGNALFTGVSPGEYCLGYRMPGLWRATKQPTTVDSRYPVSCVPQSMSSSGKSGSFTLSMGQTGLRLVIGAMLSGSISGTAYYDDNANASQDEQETVASGVICELVNSDGFAIMQMTTGSNGRYVFEGVAPGRYTVRFTAPAGCVFSGTERSMGRGGVQPSEENVSSTRPISVSASSTLETADAGVVRMASLTGVIFEDRDANAQRAEDENGLGGVSVQLMNAGGRMVEMTTVTDTNGQFVFDGVMPGNYRLRVDAPEGYVFSGSMQDSILPLESERDGKGFSPQFTVLGGAKVSGIGYGLLTQGTISGCVWQDADFDGEKHLDESGLRGVSLELYENGTDNVRSVTTSKTGEFVFDKLMPGEYSLRVTLESGWVFTAEGGDSRASRDEGRSCLIELGQLHMGETIGNVKIGALRPSSIGGIAWLDADDDGRKQADSAGVMGMDVILTMMTGEDAGREYRTTTGENGAYRFDGVMPGTATLTFVCGDGYAFARNAEATNGRRVSCVPMVDATIAETNPFTIVSGVDQLTMDAGIVGVGGITGRIWNDTQTDGLMSWNEEGVPAASVLLVDAQTGLVLKTAETDEDGNYELDFVRKGNYVLRVELPENMIFAQSGDSLIADRYQSSANTDAFALAMGESRMNQDIGAIVPAKVSGRFFVDVNENGTDDGEAGYAGAVVSVMDGGTAIASAETNKNGEFIFPMLRPGAYRLRCTIGEEALYGIGCGLTLADIDATEGETGAFWLSCGDMVRMADIPVVLASSVSGSAFGDSNVDGVFDADESGLDSVIVQLLDENGRELRATYTDELGAYCFGRLRTGVYSVRFTLGENMLLTDCVEGVKTSSVPVVDGNVGTTLPFALAMGEDNNDVNVGGIVPGCIGDTVWLDANGNGLQDYGEAQISGVELTLFVISADGEMTECASARSDEYGYYKFDGLRPGRYVIRVRLEDGDTLTRRIGSPMGEIDSDASPETGETYEITLASGKTLRNIDFGFVNR